MSHFPAVIENCPQTRAALLSYLSRKLAPLARSGDLRAQLAAFLAPIGTDAIAGALRPSAEDTAHHLADALLRHVARIDPNAAIADLIADAFPRLSQGVRGRLIAFTQALHELATDNDGTVTERDLYPFGFGAPESSRLMPMAGQIIARIERRAPPEAEREGTPMGRLIEAGTRAGLRHDPQSLALAS